MDPQSDQHGQKRADDVVLSDAAKRVKFADKCFSMLGSTFLADDTAVGESAPKTPKLDENADKGHLSQATSADLSLSEHEDEKVSFSLNDAELDELETYELNFHDDEFYDDGDWLDDGAVIKQLTFPYSKHERVLKDSELQRLDSLADTLEIQRLTKMQALTDAATMPSVPSSCLHVSSGHGVKRSTKKAIRYGYAGRGSSQENSLGWTVNATTCSPLQVAQ